MNATEYEDWHLHYACVPEILRTNLPVPLFDVCRYQIRGSLIRRGIKEEPNHAFEEWDDRAVTIEKVTSEILTRELNKMLVTEEEEEAEHKGFKKYSPDHLSELAFRNLPRYERKAANLALVDDENFTYEHPHPFENPDDVDRAVIIAELMTNTDKTVVVFLARSEEELNLSDLPHPNGPSLPLQQTKPQGDFGDEEEYDEEGECEEEGRLENNDE